jgi:hypothetical protein
VLSFAACRQTDPSVAAIKQLGDSDPHVRAAAAASLRAMATADAASIGDVGEAYWKAKLASVAVGSSSDKVQEVLGVQGEGGEGGGGGSSMHFTLDDHYAVTAFFAEDRKTYVSTFQSFSPLVHSSRRVDVVAPKRFSGRWTTYFVNGAVAGEADCVDGNVTHVSTYFDNGQLQATTDIANGNPDGIAVTFFRNGKRATDGRYAAGKRVGPWVEYHENGTAYLEATYVDGQVEGSELLRREDGSLQARTDYHAGKETGQAGWDAKGKLEYARGTTAEDAGK